MNFTIPSFLTYLAAWAGVISIIWFLFEKTEETLNDETKKSITSWLKDLQINVNSKNWPLQFITIFDKIFGKRFLSLRFFYGSYIASISFTFIMFLLWATFQTDQLSQYGRKDTLLINVIAAIFLTGILNVFPDYISLIESRYIIGLMAKTNKILNQLMFLFVDLLFTGLIWLISFIIILSIVGLRDPIMNTPLLFTVIEFKKIIKDAIIFISVYSGKWSFFGIYFYATFFTSLWVWVYAISGFVIKSLIFLGVKITRIKSFLDIENKPLRSIGLVAIAFVTILFIAFPLFR